MPVSETIVSATRWELSISHFCARSSTRARPSKPYASHSGWAARPRRGHLRDSLGAEVGDGATISPGGGVLDRYIVAWMGAWALGLQYLLLDVLLDTRHLRSPVR